jgi:hypothetical protein
MPSNKRSPQWWQVYVMLPLLVSLFLLEMRLPLTHTEHIVAQLGILFLIYGFIHLWLRANQSAWNGLGEGFDGPRGEWQVKVYEIPPVRLSASKQDARPLIQVPPEIDGVLSDTFQMGSMDAESFAIKNVPQELDEVQE